MPRTSTRCHQTADMMNARGKRRTVLGVLRAAAMLGMSDGVTYAVCVLCKNPAYRTVPPGAPDALEIGHVLADANGGCYGGDDNLVPMCYRCNRDLLDETATNYVLHYDTRTVYTFPAPSEDPGAGAAPERTRPAGTADGRGRRVWVSAHATVSA